jgi:hypothetical protein
MLSRALVEVNIRNSAVKLVVGSLKAPSSCTFVILVFVITSNGLGSSLIVVIPITVRILTATTTNQL